jgi:hypothetical protein
MSVNFVYIGLERNGREGSEEKDFLNEHFHFIFKWVYKLIFCLQLSTK